LACSKNQEITDERDRGTAREHYLGESYDVTWLVKVINMHFNDGEGKFLKHCLTVRLLFGF
jgi:hypothetical protein